jgi:cobaltochelatase CobN
VARHADGKQVNVARMRGNLFVCANACCCGRTDLANSPLNTELYHEEWMRRRFRNIVHLTVGGCLGPCALANVNLLLFDGRALWLHSMNRDEDVVALFDWIEAMLDADEYLDPPRAVAPHLFTASSWQERPDGQYVEDRRLWLGRQKRPDATPSCEMAPEELAAYIDLEHGCERATVDPAIASMPGQAALPRRNGELVFAEPWQGRAFGMVAALSDAGVFDYETFRQRLIARIAEAERRPELFDYYACWLAAFEDVLQATGIVLPEDLRERTAEFEFGERVEVF